MPKPANKNATNPERYSQRQKPKARWHYSESLSNDIKEVFEKELPFPGTIGSSNIDLLAKVFYDNCLSQYELASSSGERYIIRQYHTNLINRFKKKLSGSVNSIDWLSIAQNNNVPYLELVGWSVCSGKSITVTRGTGDISSLTDFLQSVSGAGRSIKYREDIPSSATKAIFSAGNLIGTMHRAGLLSANLSGLSIAIAQNTGQLSLFDLETMTRCPAADSENIFSDFLSANLAGLAGDILELFGPGALEILIEGYLEKAVGNFQQKKEFYNHIHVLACYFRSKKYLISDKLFLHDSDCFQTIKLADNFRAKVFLRSKKPKEFSAISSKCFTAEQWRTVLEPLVLSKKIFTNKALVLKFGDFELPVSVEGGPAKKKIAKWKLGHVLIDRGIDSAMPLAMIMYKKQAVLITEKKTDNICRNFRNILIVKPSALGDVARAIPVLTALREQYPNSRITWLIRPEFADLVKYHPALDDIIIFDKKKFNRLSFATFKWIARYRHLLLGSGFDLVLDMQGLMRTGLITGLTKSPVRIGYRRAREFAWLFYNKKVDTPEINHSNDDCWRVAQAAGVKSKEPGFGVAIDQNSYESARIILTKNAIGENDNYISILPGGTADEKIWSAHNYGKLAKAIYEKYNIRSVIIGAGKRESELAGTICDISGQQATINLVGQTTLSEMTAILKNSFMAIGNDSGPLHIAAAIPLPVIGIYGPTNPKAVGPVNQLQNVIEAGPDIKRHGRYSKEPRHNINNITVEQVFDKFTEILNNTSQQSER